MAKYEHLDDAELSELAQILKMNWVGPKFHFAIEQAKRANAMEAVLQHALELGHLGEGSTANWAKQVLKSYRGET